MTETITELLDRTVTIGQYRHSFMDMADSVTYSTLVVAWVGKVPPYLSMMKFFEDEFDIPMVSKMGGYAEMNPDNPYRNNVSQTKTPLKITTPSKVYKKAVAQASEIDNFWGDKKNISSFYMVQYDPTTNEYSQYTEYGSCSYNKLMSDILDLYSSEIVQMEKTSKIDSLAQNYDLLSDEEQKEFLAALLQKK